MGWRSVHKREAGGWEGWAADHGWLYRSPADDLVGVFLPARPGGEHIDWSVRGTSGHLGFLVFLRTSPDSVPGDLEQDHHLAVFLPRPVHPDLLSLEPAAAFATLGPGVVSPFAFDWHGNQWMVGSGHDPEPGEVEGTLDQLRIRVDAAPAAFWEPT